MKPWPIKLVEQKGKTCAIACLAMIRGVEFDEVAKEFKLPEEMTLMKCADYLGDYGYSVLVKEIIYHATPKFAREIISTPFAPVHIISCKWYADEPIEHVVVMDQKGKISDPAESKDGASLEGYYMLTRVLGIWRPTDL